MTNEEVMITVIDKLVNICEFFRFDGYLLNVENPVISGESMVRFVKSLKVKLADKCGKQSYVIWYDAVTYGGKLSWQNKLNDNNKLVLFIL